ncbi:MAG: right-handed parallel beta-helix repeat-containing protein, partial [Thermomicrobiales bacterium]|nr:right-handed parallel beta-helix repeat-containing protein [Thermomicrobiales bacterium]
ANCGACGHACGAGQTCQGGVCGVECGSDFCPSASEICITNACAPCDVTCTGNPAECGTALQAALNGTRATLHVCPGRYQGGFSIDRHVTVIGAGQGEDDRVDTILDGNDTQRVLLLTSGVVMLQGLHVTRGNAGSIVGGGINNDGATLIMQDCTVSHSACRLGGGINHQGGVLTMTRCTVRGNEAQTDGAGGGGLRLLRQATLTDCLVTGNTCDGIGGGIGVSTGLASQTVTLAGTTRIEGNTAHQGGGLFTSDTNVTIGADCRITGNTATLAGEGGGITRLSGAVTLEGTADPSPIVTGNCPENRAGAVPKCQAGGVCPATP